MCGIVGIISKDAKGLYGFHAEILKELLVADSLRGLDSTGVFGITMKNELELAKQAVDPHVFMRTKEFKEFVTHVPNFRLVIGHNRKATSGEIKSKNAHPFKEGHIVLVHNGSVFDHKALNKEVDVDSHALCHGFAADGAVETIQKVRGMFALVWYDLKEQALYFWRNKERPLEIFENQTDIYVASEKAMLRWILNRDSRCVGSDSNGSYRNVTENTLVKMTFNPFKLETKELKEKEFATYPARWMPHTEGQACSFEVDGTGQEEPDWVRHLESVKQERGQMESSRTDEFTAKDAIGLYPFDSEAIFAYQKLRAYTDTPKKWELEGEIYLPGKPSFKCLIYTDSNLDLKLLKKWKDAHTLLTKVKTVLRVRDHIVIHGSNLTIPEKIKTFNSWMYPKVEWQHICRAFKCSKCNADLDVNKPEFTSINARDNKFGVYRVVCHECTLQALPKARRDALIQSSSAAV